MDRSTALWLGAGVGLVGLYAWWSASSASPAAPALAGPPQPTPGQPGMAPAALTLPPLPFPVAALAPIMGEATVRAHHDVHQQAYVDGVNHALGQLHQVRQQAYPPETRRPMRSGLAQNLAFYLGGAYLHDLFWRSLAPPGKGGSPSPELVAQVQRDFGSIGALAEEMTDLGMAMQGSGWVLLAWSPYLDRLITLSVGNHDQRVPPGVVPLLPIDVWEHAYYLDHGPDRGAYLRQWWGLLDWSELSRRFAAATGQRAAAPAPAPAPPPAAARPAPSPRRASPPPEEERVEGDETDQLAAERTRRMRRAAKRRADARAMHREALEAAREAT